MPTLQRRKDEQPKRVFKNNKHIYQSSRWHTYSRQYRKANRLCVKCLEQGITKISECVDHIVSIQNGGEIWNPDNHQALCNSCHSKKTKAETTNNLTNE